jgi:hypothetical protein
MFVVAGGLFCVGSSLFVETCDNLGLIKCKPRVLKTYTSRPQTNAALVLPDPRMPSKRKGAGAYPVSDDEEEPEVAPSLPKKTKTAYAPPRLTASAFRVPTASRPQTPAAHSRSQTPAAHTSFARSRNTSSHPPGASRVPICDNAWSENNRAIEPTYHAPDSSRYPVCRRHSSQGHRESCCV